MADAGLARNEPDRRPASRFRSPVAEKEDQAAAADEQIARAVAAV
jgi:hypothetical protein